MDTKRRSKIQKYAGKSGNESESGNLRYMSQFYQMYSKITQQAVAQIDDDKIFPQIVAKLDNDEISPQIVDELCFIPWGHHRYIIDKCKGNPEKALFM